jgi:hypothetical protein
MIGESLYGEALRGIAFQAVAVETPDILSLSSSLSLID